MSQAQLTPQVLDSIIKNNLGKDYYQTIILDVSNGCGLNFECVVISDIFQGKNRLNRCRLINTILKKELEVIHAFSCKCFTIEEWSNQRV
ncbi:hypothetical protein ACO0SA_001876 [Hanseniaspora valbyensis]